MTRSCNARRSRGGLDPREDCASQTTARLETPPEVPCPRWGVSVWRVRRTTKSRYQNCVCRFFGTSRLVGSYCGAAATRVQEIVECPRILAIARLRADAPP